MDRYINAPIDNEIVNSLKSRRLCIYNRTIYTAEITTHKGEAGRVIGSAGTNYKRPNGQIYTIALLEHGLKGMLGKGKRSDNVIESMHKNNAVYFAAIGGPVHYYQNA